MPTHFREVNECAGNMTCANLVFELDPGLEGTQVGNGEGFLIVVGDELLRFVHLINGSSKMLQSLFDRQCPQLSTFSFDAYLSGGYVDDRT
jgi:hypothetical protein